MNLTFLMDINLEVPTVGKLDLEDTSLGAAFGAGFDYRLDKNFLLILDVKQVCIGSEVLLGGTKVSAVKVDPVLYSVGLGWRFLDPQRPLSPAHRAAGFSPSCL